MITGLFAGVLGIMYFKFSLATINQRRSKKVSLGSGESGEIQNVVSAHNNANNYIPIFLILLFLYEKAEYSFFYLTLILGTLFCFGRLLHFKALTAEKMDFKNRVRGMKLTLANIGSYLYALFFV